MARILIIDDDFDSREILVTLFERHGHTPSACADPHEGLRRAREERPDAVVTEFFGGFGPAPSFLETMRSDPALASIPVVVFTTYVFEETRARIERAGGVFLPKPSLPIAVLAALQRVAFPAEPAPSGGGAFLPA